MRTLVYRSILLLLAGTMPMACLSKFGATTPKAPPPVTVTPTLTPAGGGATLSPTPTSSATVTPSITPSVTVTPPACAATPLAVATVSITLNYGVSRTDVIRTQADWDAYVGRSGTAPPVDLSLQMIVAVNWGTEYCQPGGGRVVDYSIPSACPYPDHWEVQVLRGSTCTCGGGCYFTMADNQVTAIALPASSLPVSFE